MVLLSFSCELHIIFFHICPVYIILLYLALPTRPRSTQPDISSLFRSALLCALRGLHTVQIESGYKKIKMNEAEKREIPIRYQVNGLRMPSAGPLRACMNAERVSPFFFFYWDENIFHPENVSQIKVDRYLLIYL